MRGFCTVRTQNDYDAGFAEETALLNAPQSHRLRDRFARFCFDFQANVAFGALLAPPRE